MSQEVFDKFRQDVEACLEKARKMFNVKLEVDYIRLDIRGRVGGWAKWWPDRNQKMHLGLRFNHEAILKHNEDMTKNTIPHEVAHLVGFELGTDENHGEYWKHYCRSLGGDASRCHDMVLTPARNTQLFKYVLASGRVVELGPKYHANIQSHLKQYYTRNPREPILYWQWEGYNKAAIQQITSPTPNAVPAYASKRVKAEAIYKTNRGLPRKDMIALFVQQADMTPAGAATYYQNFKTQGI